MSWSEDPYDAVPVVRSEESLGSRAASVKSSDYCREIEKLELHRGEINGKRIGILEEIKEIADRQSNEGLDELDVVLVKKLEAITRVQDITKSNFSAEDEAAFDQGVEELTSYIQGSFDPLAEEDEYDEDARYLDEAPLSEGGHSADELRAIKAAGGSTVVRDHANPFTSSYEDESTNDFSSEESPEALFAAFGTDSFDPEPQTADEDIADPEDVQVEDVQAEIVEDQAELREDVLKTPTEPISVVELEELEEFAEEDPADEAVVADDLSADDSEVASFDEETATVAEIEGWGQQDGREDIPDTEFLAEQPDELASATVDSDELPEDEDSLGEESYSEGSIERF